MMPLRTVLFLLIGISTYAQQGPNIIFIMSDDHDADAISAYNKTFIATPNIDRLAAQGMRFTRCFVGNSICAPARATILTGQHSHMNGIIDNRLAFDSSKITLPKLLKAQGYQTALIGKWHLKSLPSGFDYWNIYPGQGAYYRPMLIDKNNDTIRYEGYSTRVVTSQALDWLKNKRNPSKPFFLMFHHKAPHRNFVPELKFLEIFSKKLFPAPPSLNPNEKGKGTAFSHQRMSILKDMTYCTDLKIDPVYLQNIPHLQPDSNEIRAYHFFMNAIPAGDRARIKEIYAERGRKLQKDKPTGKALLYLKYQWYMQDFMACVASIDESVGSLLNYLDESGLAKNTVVIYTSDQGFYLGENGWFDKRFMYDVSMQTPLIVRWPGRISAAAVNRNLVQNIDFAPTILDLAGAGIPGFMQGLSIKPLLLNRQVKLPRSELYYHYYEYPIDHYVLPHLGIREDRYKLIYFYTVNEWEFYDLQADPSEQNNLIHSPKHSTEIARMKKRLVEVRKNYGDVEPVGSLQ